MEYRIVISSKMRAVSEVLTGSFIGMDHCITETRRNLIVRESTYHPEMQVFGCGFNSKCLPHDGRPARFYLGKTPRLGSADL